MSSVWQAMQGSRQTVNTITRELITSHDLDEIHKELAKARIPTFDDEGLANRLLHVEGA